LKPGLGVIQGHWK